VTLAAATRSITSSTVKLASTPFTAAMFVTSRLSRMSNDSPVRA